MNRENLIAFLKAHGAEIRGYGVKSLALFGSVARDEATANSDIDRTYASTLYIAY
jgi:predicted nucleotidyltransferase